MQNSRKKTKIPEIFSSKLKIFKGVALFIPFLLTNIFKNRNIYKNLLDILNFLRFLGKKITFIPKTQEKNSKLKEKTQRPEGLVLSHPPKWY